MMAAQEVSNIMADTAGFTMGFVTAELKQLSRNSISSMDIDELRVKLKQAVPFGFVSLGADQIDALTIEAAHETLSVARDRALSISR